MIFTTRRWSALRTICLGLGIVAGALACGDGTTDPQKGPILFRAPVTFVVAGIVPEVWRVDIVVNNRNVDPVHGSFETASTDRVTIQVPAGDSLNAFARAFDGDSVILYIGETYFDVRKQEAMEVPILLKYKGPHVIP